MTRAIHAALAVCALATLPTSHASAISIDSVSVGNPGNANDSSGFGAVAYNYRIAKHEVTNAQYAAFLNEKAKSDPLGLYYTDMGSATVGGIIRSGVSGSFTYTTKANLANKPVTFVDWYDAIRFTNWLHNGQGSGDTETGAYTLIGGTPTPSNGLSITRNVGATWFLPSEDEWYKAAYHQPSSQGGDSDDYWLYPTGTNTTPTIATANSVGDISNPGANVANYRFGADWNRGDGNLTTVGSAGLLSDSFYGTADQGGNVWEWNEDLVSESTRGMRGGGMFSSTANHLQSSSRFNVIEPQWEFSDLGFRVASVPEPSSFLLAALSLTCLVLLGRRK
jgi:formylglycine-generating enzyme required for sulfatase activity